MTPLLLALASIVLLGSIVYVRHRRARTQRGKPVAETHPAARETEAGGVPESLPVRDVRADDVRFTIYRPAAVPPEHWCPLLVFAHRWERPPDASPDEASPAEKVRIEAERVLGSKTRAYSRIAEDSAVPLASGTELCVVPSGDGLRFNPPQALMDWSGEMETAHFQVRADAALDGSTARGSISIFAGPLLLAEMALVIRVSAEEAESAERSGVEATSPPYRRVFASYSHLDEPIVRQMEAYARSFGDEYLRDVTTLRSGERWNARIAEMIENADVFQLFWSWNAMESDYVRQEWTHALALGRPHFIRPVYWEDPLPSKLDRGLPSPELIALHFQKLPFASGVASRTSPGPSPAADREQAKRDVTGSMERPDAGDGGSAEADVTGAIEIAANPPVPESRGRVLGKRPPDPARDFSSAPLPATRGRPGGAQPPAAGPPPSPRRSAFWARMLPAAAAIALVVTAVGVSRQYAFQSGSRTPTVNEALAPAEGGAAPTPVDSIAAGPRPITASRGGSAGATSAGGGDPRPRVRPPEPRVQMSAPSAAARVIVMDPRPTGSDPTGVAFGRDLSIALSTQSAYRRASGSTGTAIETARRLGAGYVLDGTVRRADGRFVVHMLLIDIATGDTVRSRQFSGTDANVVARDIERSLEAVVRR